MVNTSTTASSSAFEVAAAVVLVSATVVVAESTLVVDVVFVVVFVVCYCWFLLCRLSLLLWSWKFGFGSCAVLRLSSYCVGIESLHSEHLSPSTTATAIPLFD